jgi:hypothetical protein
MGAENVRTLEFSGMGFECRNRYRPEPQSGHGMACCSREGIHAANRHRCRPFATQIVRVQDGKDQTERLNSVSDSPWNDQYSFWLTPFGFIKGALANNASLSSATVDGKRFAVVTFSIKNIYKIVGFHQRPESGRKSPDVDR